MTGADLAVVGARSVRLPSSSVEPQQWITLQPEKTSLPARSPGLHMHPQLRGTLVVNPVGRVGSGA